MCTSARVHSSCLHQRGPRGRTEPNQTVRRVEYIVVQKPMRPQVSRLSTQPARPSASRAAPSRATPTQPDAAALEAQVLFVEEDVTVAAKPGETFCEVCTAACQNICQTATPAHVPRTMHSSRHDPNVEVRQCLPVAKLHRCYDCRERWCGHANELFSEDNTVLSCAGGRACRRRHPNELFSGHF